MYQVPKLHAEGLVVAHRLQGAALEAFSGLDADHPVRATIQKAYDTSEEAIVALANNGARDPIQRILAESYELGNFTGNGGADGDR